MSETYDMVIEVKQHTEGQLVHAETIKVDCLFNLTTIENAYPGWEVREISFFAWNRVNVYLHKPS